MPFLTAESSGNRVEFGQRLAVGRGPDNDLVIADPRVSTAHALLAYEGARLKIMDLNSRNGTYVDGIRIGRWVDLVEGSELRFGPAGPYKLERVNGRKTPAAARLGATVAASEADHGKVSTRLRLYSKDLANGTIMVEQAGMRFRYDGSMRFLLLYILAAELLEEPEETPEPSRGWVDDDRLRIKLWGLHGADRRDPSALGKLIHDTRAMMRRKGIDSGFIQKKNGATRIALLPGQVELHTP